MCARSRVDHVAAVAHLEQHLHSGLVFAVGLDQPRQQVLAGGVHGDHVQPLAAGVDHGVGCGATLVEQAEHRLGMRQVGPPRGREPAAAAVALQQLDPELGRERRHGGRDRGLRHPQPLGGALHAAAVGDCDQRTQLRDRH